jgi:hypothetical protein
VAGGAFAPGHLGELIQLIPFEMVDEAVAENGKTQAKVRDLPGARSPDQASRRRQETMNQPEGWDLFAQR